MSAPSLIPGGVLVVYWWCTGGVLVITIVTINIIYNYTVLYCASADSVITIVTINIIYNYTVLQEHILWSRRIEIMR